MKKWFLPMILVFGLVLSACGNNAATPNNNNSAGNTSGTSTNTTDSTNTSGNTGAEQASGMVTYQSETGPVEVPAHPQRIVGLTNAPNIISAGGTLVGVDEWTNKNPLFTDKLAGVEVVSEESLEKIIELEPDLIIAGSHMKNLDKLSEIAPTIVYTWGKLDYLAQQLEIGKLLGKEAETQAWIDDFKQRAEEAAKEIKAKHGEDVTVSVFEYDTKSLFVFGDNWARGTEILYQAMGLGMPEKVKTDALGPGYFTLSLEVASQYAGDFIILSKNKAGDASFLETETWKNIPAVKNGHVIEIDTDASSYSDPTTLDSLLNIFKEGFLSQS